MQVGEKWAYREKAYTPGWPVQAVEILQFGPPRSKKVRIKFVDGKYPGLDQWVPQVRLRVLWDDVDAWLRDERLFSEACQASQEPMSRTTRWAAWYAGYGYPVADGLHISYPDDSEPIVEVSDLPAFAGSLGLDQNELLSKPHAYLDRHGTYVAPWTVALSLAKRVAEVFPDDVLAKVAEEERTLQREAIHGHHFVYPGGRDGFIPPEKCSEWLHEKEPVFALLREWCGVPSVDQFNELEALRDEVSRLRALIEQAAQRFEALNHPRIAKQLRTDMVSPRPARTKRQ